MKNPVGVFDSGIGGLTVLKELICELPNEDFIYFGDSLNAPYGPKRIDEIIGFSKNIIQFLLSKNCKTVIIACNTATAAAVYPMREMFSLPIIGLEPAVKPACLNTKTRNIGVLATEGTFRGEHFKNTSDKYKDYVTIHLQVAKRLVELAEKGQFTGKEVEDEIKTYLTPLINKSVDQIVLGCTHYRFFIDCLEKMAGEDIEIIDSSQAVARRTKDVLMSNKILNTSPSQQKIEFYTSGNLDIMNSIIHNYLSLPDICAEYVKLCP